MTGSRGADLREATLPEAIATRPRRSGQGYLGWRGRWLTGPLAIVRSKVQFPSLAMWVAVEVDGGVRTCFCKETFLTNSRVVEMAGLSGNSRSLTRAVNRQLIVREVLRQGPVSRTRLAEATDLSKPTVSEIVGDLVTEGWLSAVGEQRGTVGRNSALYAFRGASGRVVGIDLGGTKMRAAIANLDGRIIDELVEATDVRGGEYVVAQMVGICRRLAGDDWKLVTSVAVGSPGVLNPVTGGMDLAFNIPTFGDIHVRDELESALGVPVIVENDVNMGALGEQWYGHAVGAKDVVFVAVGTGLGMGVIADGQLRRGSRGAAGEIAYLPLGADPLDAANQRKGPLEEAVAGAAIVRRYQDAVLSGDPDLAAVPDILDAATEGQPLASRVVREVARDLALGLVAVVAVLDPELVVLGGGIGSNEAFAIHVREVLAEVTQQEPPNLVVSALSHRASLAGALAVALEASYDRLFGPPSQATDSVLSDGLLPPVPLSEASPRAALGSSDTANELDVKARR